MTLDDYRRKREFSKTPEPEPLARSARGGRAIFVVQLHHASRRHYDFRLQIGDALKSWAVPKGPSYDPAVKRMAVEVEDHPLDYATFEGQIPKGHYGGGHVALFDTGVWTTAGDADAQLAKGHLRFDLFGNKLKGGWHLVRTAKPANQPQWLLFKEQDGYAGPLEADDLLANVTPPPPEDLKRAGKGKSGRKQLTEIAFIDAKSKRWTAEALALAGAEKRSWPAGAFSPQLAKLGEVPPKGEAWVHELKWDGYRIVVTIDNGKVRLWSRNAIEWTSKLPEIASAIAALGLKSAALDGELIAGQGTKKDFNLLQSTLSGDSQGPLTLVLFDLLHIDGVDIQASPLRERKLLLQHVLDNPPRHLAFSSHIPGDGTHAFQLAARKGFEGIVSKRADRPYHHGRSDDWRKTKSLASDEFAVVGFTAPKGSRSGFGSLLLATPDETHGWRYVGRVGSGFSDALIDEITQRLNGKHHAKPTVFVPPHDTDLRSATWFSPSLVAEVIFRGKGKHGLLRQPSLKDMRTDKTPDDLKNVDAMPVKSSTKANTKAEVANTSREQGVPVEGVQLSSPDRVVFPDDKITKRDVADYYQAVMPWLLPEIVDRPLSIIRCTQGVGRPCFFQKHHTAGLELVDTVKLKEESGHQADYLVVRDAKAVMELVQFNALEFHPWGSTVEAPEMANRLVFDLDPGPNVAWSEVVSAARRIRELLEAIKLVSYVRTSGGKGLHVVVPLDPGNDWNIAKPFARSFAETLTATDPLKFVATASKKYRKGKIFIDYLRNGRGATSVASFSLRARAGAPVAMPLRWDELGKIKSGDAYDIHSAVRRLKALKQHPWHGIAKVTQNLDRVIGLSEKVRK
ncbi:DNA ligase D [Thermomonas sp.]